MADTSLAGKTALVTGGAGGLGKAIAQKFLTAGANVVICDVNKPMLEACTKELSLLGSLHAIEADITQEESVTSLVDETVSKFGQLDVLVNNAGIMDRFDPAGAIDAALWNKVLAVNLTAPLLLTKAVVSHFLSRGPSSGAIVNVGSVSSLKGGTAGVAYTASKHGLMGLTKHTAASYAKKGIRCNIVMPGGMATNIGASMANGVSPEGMQLCQKLSELMPGMCELDDVANIALYLSSDSSKVVNGAAISADGGWTAAW